MNLEQAYENYVAICHHQASVDLDNNVLTIYEFSKLLLIDDNFNTKWSNGCTKKLTLDERIDLASHDKLFDPCDFGIGPGVTKKHCHKVCDAYDVPKRKTI